MIYVYTIYGENLNLIMLLETNMEASNYEGRSNIEYFEKVKANATL